MRKVHKWSDIKQGKRSEERVAQIEQEAKEMAGALPLRMLRETLALTQEEVAQKAGMTQPQVSQLEGRDNVQLATLQRYIEGVGGHLEIFAVINGQRIPLLVPNAQDSGSSTMEPLVPSVR